MPIDVQQGPVVGSQSVNLSLQGRRALVTGASRGIGRAIAIHLARRGALVVCASRTANVLEGLVKELNAEGLHAISLPADVSDPARAMSLAADAEAAAGGLDIVVNNAGVSHPGGDPYGGWMHVIQTNLTAPYLISEGAAAIFAAQRSGKIINIGSILGLVTDYHVAHAYVAAKHGMIGLTKSFAVEYAPHNVQVNCVAPGYVRTPMTEPEFNDEQIHRAIVDRTPTGRWSEVDDVVGIVGLLAGDESQFITGQTIAVDGGWTAL
jgi:NAD(P)-dependent dehydrogenase (short-subunit alcohol dehydrogenase family)